VEEIEPSIRYCAYTLTKKGGAIPAEIAKLLSEASSSQAARPLPEGDAFSTITWLGREIPLKNQKLREKLVAIKELESERVAKAKDLEAKLQSFDKILIEYGEVVAMALNDVKADEVSPPPPPLSVMSKTII